MAQEGFKNYLAIFCSIILGGIFLISGLTKLYPIEPFEYTFVEFGIGGWKSSVFIARLFIGFELACGALLIGNLFLKRFTIPLVFIVLLLFNIYLVIQFYKFGNKGNCGCFGDYFQFTPLEGILKNIGMMILAAGVFFFHRGLRFKGIKVVSIALLLISFSLPFILNPIDLETSKKHLSGQLNYKLDLDILYHDDKNEPPETDLRKGKWVIAFMSLTCPHCRIAAKKLHVMKLKNPALPIYMVLNGSKENLQPFFDETRATNIQWSSFRGPENFIKMAGPNLPEIVLVNNSMVENKVNYLFLDQKELEKWIEKK